MPSGSTRRRRGRCSRAAAWAWRRIAALQGAARPGERNLLSPSLRSQSLSRRRHPSNSRPMPPKLLHLLNHHRERPLTGMSLRLSSSISSGRERYSPTVSVCKEHRKTQLLSSNQASSQFRARKRNPRSCLSLLLSNLSTKCLSPADPSTKGKF